MVRNFVVTLACLGAGIAPGIAGEAVKTGQEWVIASSQLDRITAGNAASLILAEGSLRAIANHQNSNSSFSNAVAESFVVFVDDGSGDGKNVLMFKGFAETPDITVNSGSPPPVTPPEPPKEPVYRNVAERILAERLNR